MHANTSRKAAFQGFKPLVVVMLLAALVGLLGLLAGVSPKTVGLGLADVLLFALIGTAMLRGLEPRAPDKLPNQPVGH